MHIIARLKKSIIKKKRRKAKILSNVFDTSFRKNALVSYVKGIFESETITIDESHTNRLKTLCISESLADLDFNVDIINWESKFEGDLNKYELIIGLGRPLEDILQNRSKEDKPKVIWFGTGCNPIFSNKVTLQRTVEFYYKKRVPLLSSSRYIREDWPLQHEISDWIILHGDDFAKSTYRNYNLDTVLAPVFKHHSIIRSDQDWGKSQKNFLWFGSAGAIHKGLDLLIDTFKNLPQYSLHICGHLETDFFDIYKEDIVNSPNIITYGFVGVKTELYGEILSKCAFVLYPSASEGSCPAVITCMANGGLIPVITRNTDINLEKYGIEILGFKESDILLAIEKSQQLSLADMKAQSAEILLNTMKFHTFEFFKDDFKKKLSNALEILDRT